MGICALGKKRDMVECVRKAAETLRAGGIILYPTDTLYGLGADALSDEAVARVYDLKGRSERKPMHAVVASLAMAEKYCIVNDTARRLAAAFLPGPLTLVLEKRPGLDSGILRGRGTIGIRIPDDPLCLALARAFDRPFTTTSANVSGEAAGRDVHAILAQLGERARMIDLVVDGGELPPRAPSTVVDVSCGAPAILRVGAISERDILAVAA